MPIVITHPADGDPFGPAFHISAVSDFIGPLESGSFWRIELTAPANENLQMEMTHPWVTNSLAVKFYNNTQAIPIPVPIGILGWTGMPGQVRITLEEPTAGVVDTGTQQIIVDRTTGQTSELKQWLDWKLAQQPVGLTEEEHAAVLQTNVGVIGFAGINPLDMVGDLAAAFASSPPLSFGSLSTTYTLTGDGEMPDIGDLLHTKLAIYFVATTIPAGLSHRHGQSEEYPSRLVQWRTVHAVGGVEMVTEVLDFITHGELFRWQQSKPLRIEYSILPGVVIAARWWQFP